MQSCKECPGREDGEAIRLTLRVLTMISLNSDPLARQKGNGRKITKMCATVIAHVLQARDEDEGRGRRDSLIRFADSSAVGARLLQMHLPP